jgi:hypothetical protein
MQQKEHAAVIPVGGSQVVAHGVSVPNIPYIATLARKEGAVDLAPDSCIHEAFLQQAVLVHNAD